MAFAAVAKTSKTETRAMVKSAPRIGGLAHPKNFRFFMECPQVDSEPLAASRRRDALETKGISPSNGVTHDLYACVYLDCKTFHLTILTRKPLQDQSVRHQRISDAANCEGTANRLVIRWWRLRGLNDSDNLTSVQIDPELPGGCCDLLHGPDAMPLAVVVGPRQSGMRLAQLAGCGR